MCHDINGNKYWYEGQVIPALKQQGKNTGDNKYWYEGLVIPLLARPCPKFFVVFID